MVEADPQIYTEESQCHKPSIKGLLMLYKEKEKLWNKQIIFLANKQEGQFPPWRGRNNQP